MYIYGGGYTIALWEVQEMWEELPLGRRASMGGGGGYGGEPLTGRGGRRVPASC